MNLDVARMEETFAIPPGETIKEYVEYSSMTMEEFAQRLGVSKQTLARLYRGDQAITPDTAQKLALVTGVEAQFWAKLESNYRMALLREAREGELEADMDWIKQFPIREMSKRGFLPADYKRLPLQKQVDLFLSFFHMSSVSVFRKWLDEPRYAARTTKSVDADRYALETWVQMGVHLAQERMRNKPLPVFDKGSFLDALNEVCRLSTRLDRSEYDLRSYLLALRDKMESVGVVVVYLKKFNGVNQVNGIVRWMENRPVIILSLNGQSADRIIFSFFHEAGHVVKDGGRLQYVSRGEKTQEERGADDFAATILLPRKYETELCADNIGVQVIQDVARKANVYSGIVYGRYQFLRGCWRRANFRCHVQSISWESLGKEAWTIGYD